MIKNGEIYNIDFKGNKGSEINNFHLGIIFTMPRIKNMVFCIPLTSPKLKHFKNIKAYNERNFLELKYQNLVYIKDTDSIALLDQMRSISTLRLIKPYKDHILNEISIRLLTVKTIKYLKHIFQPKN